MAPPYICLNHLMGKNVLFHLEKRPAVRTWQTSVYIRGCVLYYKLAVVRRRRLSRSLRF